MFVRFGAAGSGCSVPVERPGSETIMRNLALHPERNFEMHLFPVAILSLLVLGACAPVQESSENLPALDLDGLTTDDYAPDRILVGFPEGDQLDAVLDGQHLGAVRMWSTIHSAAFAVPEGRSALDMVRALRATGRYKWVEPDLLRTASATATDPYYHYQWHFNAINLEAAWDYSTGDGATVAVIDTGLGRGGIDTPAHISSLGYDWVGDDTDPADENGHGTHVAGTIAQATNNGAGVAGIAYDATILPLRVLNSSGSGSTSDVISAILYAAEHGADVINMSLGSSTASSAERDACNTAVAAGLVIFAAAGNGGGGAIDYPGAYDSVVAVGATDYLDNRAPYSDVGSALDLVAPGGDTRVDLNGDGYNDGVLQETFSGSTWAYYFYQGTSMATPHASGVAALLVAAGATGAEARELMETTAVDLGAAGVDTTYGHGLIDAGAALEALDGILPSDGDDDGYTVADGDCDDGDPAIHPGATDIPGDGIDQDCSGADAAVDRTPPDILTQRYITPSRNRLEVFFTTDELATGRVCTDTGYCSRTTALGTTHDTGSFSARSFRSYSITVTDALGNSITETFAR
jgi:serine protease